jgi:hypothetical protein
MPRRVVDDAGNDEQIGDWVYVYLSAHANFLRNYYTHFSPIFVQKK